MEVNSSCSWDLFSMLLLLLIFILLDDILIVVLHNLYSLSCAAPEVSVGRSLVVQVIVNRHFLEYLGTNKSPTLCMGVSVCIQT